MKGSQIFEEIFIILAMITMATGQHHTNFMPNRSVIVHLFEWKFNDIANECEQFLGPKGFAGVQLSPVNENLIVKTEKFNRPWWERYQPMSYKISTRSGNEDEFIDMSKRCNRAGVRIYVDVILNHMAAPADEMIGTAMSTANATEMSFPAVPYSAEDFHAPCGIDDYLNAYLIRNCQLVGLPDLDHSHEYVREVLTRYLNHLIDLGAAGFRIDAAKHMWPVDLLNIYKELRNLNTDFGFENDTKPFIYQEVIDLGAEAVSKTEYNNLGVVTEFLYGAELGVIMRGKAALNTLLNWGPAMGFLPHRDALVFVDNHDNQRGHGAGGDMILTHKDGKIYIAAVVFMLAHPFGIPRVMSSYAFNHTDQGPPIEDNGNDTILSPTFDENEQCNNGWICEHRWNAIANMVEFRNVANGETVSNWQDNGPNQIAFCLGNKGFIAINNDPELDFEKIVFACLEPGVYCDVISGRVEGSKCTGKSITLNQERLANFTIKSDEKIGVVAFHINSKIL